MLCSQCEDRKTSAVDGVCAVCKGINRMADEQTQGRAKAERIRQRRARTRAEQRKRLKVDVLERVQKVMEGKTCPRNQPASNIYCGLPTCPIHGVASAEALVQRIMKEDKGPMVEVRRKKFSGGTLRLLPKREEPKKPPKPKVVQPLPEGRAPRPRDGEEV